MAHAVPTPTATRRHAAPRPRETREMLARHLLAGLVYGVYAAFMQRQMGPVDAANVFYGILCGVIFAACLAVMARVGPALMPELRATMYGAFTGIALGYLYSLTGDSVLRSTGVALFGAVLVGVPAFYWFHVHDD
ncbi:hypothetical protein [Streptomyces sp. NPDC090022]|uniref:hypothetical protein n=1 Tax=Streptomyces sp. NPDC090022 TaxID=3365920 RepID=UPI003806CB0A